MTMKKRLFSAILACAMLFGMATTGFAVENKNIIIPQEFNKTKLGTRDIQLLEEKADELLDAYVIDANGVVRPVDMYYTVQEINQKTTYFGRTISEYAVTAYASYQNSDLVSLDMYDATTYGTLYFQDSTKKGQYNITRISGGWLGNSCKITDKKAHYGFDLTSAKTFKFSDSTEFFDKNVTTGDGKTPQLKLSATVKSTTGSDPESLVMVVYKNS